MVIGKPWDPKPSGSTRRVRNDPWTGRERNHGRLSRETAVVSLAAGPRVISNSTRRSAGLRIPGLADDHHVLWRYRHSRAKPSTTPRNAVQSPVLRTCATSIAKALGLAVPLPLRGRADELIEQCCLQECVHGPSPHIPILGAPFLGEHQKSLGDGDGRGAALGHSLVATRRPCPSSSM